MAVRLEEQDTSLLDAMAHSIGRDRSETLRLCLRIAHTLNEQQRPAMSRELARARIGWLHSPGQPEKWTAVTLRMTPGDFGLLDQLGADWGHKRSATLRYCLRIIGDVNKRQPEALRSVLADHATAGIYPAGYKPSGFLAWCDMRKRR